MLAKKDTPDYDAIIKILDRAIKKVHGRKPGKPKFEWLILQEVRNMKGATSGRVVRKLPKKGVTPTRMVRSIPISFPRNTDSRYNS